MADSKHMKRLKEILGAAADLNAASALLDWDMRTYMPPGSMESRSFQLASLEEAVHEKMTSRELGSLLRKLLSKDKTLTKFRRICFHTKGR